MTILVDSDVLLDVLTEDPEWYEASSGALHKLAIKHVLAINPIIYSEISMAFPKAEELDEVIPAEDFKRLELPWGAAYMAGQTFLKCKDRKVEGAFALPHFYIGAHAKFEQLPLLTRNESFYRKSFRGVKTVGVAKK